MALAAFAALALVLWLGPGRGEPLRAEAAARFHPRFVTPTAGRPAPVEVPMALTLGRGQALGSLLDQLGLTPGDREQVVSALRGHLEVRRLRPGLTVTGYAAAHEAPTTVVVTVAGEGRVRVTRVEEEWTAEMIPFERRVEVRRVVGTVEESLVAALAAAGASDLVAYRMAEVLRWDIDFNRDLRRGDRFNVLYDEVYLDGDYHGIGDVHGVLFWNRGRQLEAFRFGDGYYDDEGRPLKKMFLRSPLPFSRVTSRFSHRRYHPILKVSRPHYGVDYGAPAGTPVRATANGIVRSVGWNEGGGKTVKIRHPNDYLTAYLHLSGYRRGLRVGERISQGDVIGYVGSTGLATASHLDYRVQHRGRWIDPLGMKSVPAEPIEAARRDEFFSRRDELRAALEGGLPVLAAGPGPFQVASQVPVGDEGRAPSR